MVVCASYSPRLSNRSPFRLPTGNHYFVLSESVSVLFYAFIYVIFQIAHISDIWSILFFSVGLISRSTHVVNGRISFFFIAW